MYLGMALRVLLADESSTIKKAIQMALSDLGVEVKSVPSGLDVLTVSRSFSPDIIFADILLTKKNGYEVCAEIKADPQLRNTPVVLMWSSFMQLDQTQFQKVRADAPLEKPFDSEALRLLIERLVPRTNQHPLRGLLNHPEMPDFEESESFIRQKTEYYKSQVQEKPEAPKRSAPTQTPPPQPHKPVADSDKTQVISMKNFNADQLEEVDDFAELPLKPKMPREKIQDVADDWESQRADEFVVETEPLNEDFEEVTVMMSQKDSGPNLQKRIQDELKSYIDEAPLAKNRAANSPSATQARGLTGLEEQILKEEIRMMAEKICWQILPDITEKIVREELSKLMHGLEKS